MSTAAKIITLPQPLQMYRGGVLESVQLAFETWGEPRGDNHVVIFTGLSPDAHAASSPENPDAGWWEAMVGPGKPIDSDRFHVICFNNIGSCFGSTGPASVNPATGRRWPAAAGRWYACTCATGLMASPRCSTLPVG